MTFNEKIKTIEIQITQNETQHNIDTQTAKISDLPSGNVRKYEYLTRKDVLPQKYFHVRQ